MAAVLTTVMTLAAGLAVFGVRGAHAQQNAANAEVHVLPVQGDIYMLVGAGGNITVQAGKEVLVTSGLDVWCKRVSYPIVDRWYNKGHDH